MGSSGRSDLLTLARKTLYSLGYRVELTRIEGCRCRSIHVLSKGAVDELTLLHTRHYRPHDSRYLVGIAWEALDDVNYVALFFEREPKLARIPAQWLADKLQRHRLIGDARFTGPYNEQWRVDIHLDDCELSPQGSAGKRYDISEFMLDVPANCQ